MLVVSQVWQGVSHYLHYPDYKKYPLLHERHEEESFGFEHDLQETSQIGLHLKLAESNV